MRKTLIFILFFIPINTKAQDVTVINIANGKAVFEWDAIENFEGGSSIDTSIYQILAELSYRVLGNTDSTWIQMAEIYQPDTSFDATEDLKQLGVGAYEFSIRPFVRSGGQESNGNRLSSSQMGWSGMKGILAPTGYTVFRIIITSQD